MLKKLKNQEVGSLGRSGFIFWKKQDLSIRPSSIGVRQLGHFMVSLALCGPRRSPISRSSLLWGDHVTRTRAPQRIVPPNLPARLAVGLVLGSGPCERLPAP